MSTTPPQNIPAATCTSFCFGRLRIILKENDLLAHITSIRQQIIMLGCKELETNILELHFVMLANHDQNVFLIMFRLAQSMCFYVKLKSSCCRIYCVNLLSSIDRKLDSIDRKSCKLFFLQNFQLSPSRGVLYFVLSIKGKILTTFYKLLFMLCV